MAEPVIIAPRAIRRYWFICDIWKNTLDELGKKYGCNVFELEDAINIHLVKCQTYEEAEKFQQLKMYCKIL